MQIYEQNRSLAKFVWDEKSNRRQLLWALGICLAQWVLFKIAYPFPDFFSDSYSYIFAAAAKLDVSIWPIGYSKFLYAFHQLTYSDTALVSFQYFFLILASLYFYFSILLFYKPGKNAKTILFVFLFLDPLTLYICNYVNSDPLFAALSLFWFTELLWIIYRPRVYQFFTQAILLFLVFTVRHNAYYYPFLSILAFGFSYQSLVKKVIGSMAGLILVLLFVNHTKNEAFKMTGTRQFSLLSGWQLANNALYIYDKIDVDSTQMPTMRANLLNRDAISFFTRFDKNKEAFDNLLYKNPGNFFVQESLSPLKVYVYKHYKFNDEYGATIAWGKSSADFEPFANYIIKGHPWAYFRYFVIPNAGNYAVPMLEKLEHYNLGSDSVGRNAVYWFHYKTPKIRAVSKDFQTSFLFLLPWIFLLVNICLIGLLAWLFIGKIYMKEIVRFNRSMILFGAFWLTNLGFAVLATIQVLRYEFFPLILISSCVFILGEKLDKELSPTKVPAVRGNPVYQGSATS